MDADTRTVLDAAASSYLFGGLWHPPMLRLKPRNDGTGRGGQHNGQPARLLGLSRLFAVVSVSVFADCPLSVVFLDGGYDAVGIKLHGPVPGAWR